MINSAQSGTAAPALRSRSVRATTLEKISRGPPIPATLKIVSLVVFASTIFTRGVDPLIPKIAADLAIDAKTAALLSTAFTFPYALVQPVLGAFGDHFGKTRLMNFCLLVVALAALVCAAATSFSLLIGMRVVAGCVAGGLFPIALALIGDLVPVQQRQVAIGRLLAVGLSGNLVGASIAGVIADLVGWRGVFGVFGLFALVMTVTAFAALRGHDQGKRPPFRLASVVAGFRSVFADPRAKVCFGAVFLEGLFIHGVFPYVALLLLATGEARASIAGLVIAAFGLGGVVYSMLVSVLVARIAQRWLMIIGGFVAGAMLVLIALLVVAAAISAVWLKAAGVKIAGGAPGAPGRHTGGRLAPQAAERVQQRPMVARVQEADRLVLAMHFQ